MLQMRCCMSKGRPRYIAPALIRYNFAHNVTSNIATLPGCSLGATATELVVADDICTAEAEADRRPAYALSNEKSPLT